MFIEMRLQRQDDFQWRCTLVTDEGMYAVDHDSPNEALYWMLEYADAAEIDMNRWDVIKPPPLVDTVCGEMMHGHILRIAYNRTTAFWLAVSGYLEDGEFIDQHHGAGREGPYHALLGHISNGFRNETAFRRAIYTHSYSP